MLLLFTPFTYLFMLMYLIILVFISMTSNFFIFWLLMEILMLLFLGISYTLFVNSFSQLMIYFLIQTLASFNIFIFYLMDLHLMFILSLFLKLAMFPFFSWYINVIYRFTNFPFLLASTLHKLPPLYIFYLFTPLSYFSFIMISCVLTMLMSGVYMLYILDLRYLLIVSSMGNNSWMVMSMLNNNFFVFLLFYMMYSIFLLMIVSILGNLSKINNSHNRFQSLKSVLLFFLLVNMSAIPPVPLFFSKVFIISSLMSSFMHLSVYFLLLVLLVNILMMVSYIQSVIKFIIISFSVSSNYYLY